MVNIDSGNTLNKSSEKQLEKKYQKLWSDPKKIGRKDQNLALGWHFGYYEKGIKTHEEALINMNNYVKRLLNINNKNVNVLDVGCGVGSTVIHLAKQNPKSTFYGITLAQNEIKFAQKLKTENNLKNTYFSLQSYSKTEFQDNFFDVIYALESFCYTDEFQNLLKEMSRILSPGGKIAIIDVFRTRDCTYPPIKKIRYKMLNEHNYDKPKSTIYSLENSLKQEGFENIKIQNLSKNKNIRYFYLYAGLLYLLNRVLYQKFQERMTQKKHNSIILAGEFVNHFIASILILIHSKPSYYSITAVKKI